MRGPIAIVVFVLPLAACGETDEAFEREGEESEPEAREGESEAAGEGEAESEAEAEGESEGEGESESEGESVCAFDACGGDPAGTWLLSDFCAGNVDGRPCVEFTIDVSGVEETAVLRTDGTYAIASRGEAPAFYPSVCFSQPCDQIENALQREFGGSTCETVDGGCDCNLVIDRGETGAWEADGATLTVQADGEEPEVYAFCVEAGSLTLRGEDLELTIYRRE